MKGIERIRFATSHPRYFTERLIKACAELPKVCEHFHVPFQSGDDALLKAMARGYTIARYRRIIEQIRELMPHAAISADAIVGFPGESDAQFRRTLALVDEIGFDLLNTAAYSPRPNTPAANWPNQVEDHIKVERLQELNALVERKAKQRKLDRLASRKDSRPFHSRIPISSTLGAARVLERVLSRAGWASSRGDHRRLRLSRRLSGRQQM